MSAHEAVNAHGALRRGFAALLLVESLATALYSRRFIAWQQHVAPARARPALAPVRRVPERLLRLIAVVMVVACVRLWWRGASRQMEEVTVAVHFDAPAERIWSLMAHLPFLSALPFTSMTVVGEPVGVGTVYRWVFTLPFGLTFRFDEVVTEWVENERIARRATSGWTMEATVTLAPEGGGTSLRFTLRYAAPALWKWLAPRWFIALGCRQGLTNLVKLVETKPAGSACP